MKRQEAKWKKKNYMTNAKEAQDVLLGVYRTTVEDAAYGYHLSFLFNMGTDISQGEGSDITNYRIIVNNAFPTTQVEIQQTWQVLYKGIYRANDFLERISGKIETYNTTDKKIATLYIAEARALRAMFYFELVRRYGNIPLITSTEMSYQAPTTFTQATPDKYMNLLKTIFFMLVKSYHMQSTISFVRTHHIVLVKGQHLGSWQKCMLHGQDILYKIQQNGKMLPKQHVSSSNPANIHYCAIMKSYGKILVAVYGIQQKA